MISNGFFYLFIFVVMLSSQQLSFAQEKKVNTESDKTDIFYLCKRHKDTRWLRAYKLENGKCNTLYSKEGYLQVVGSATYFSSCEGVLHSVQKNLEEGGFKCDSISRFSVLELE